MIHAHIIHDLKKIVGTNIITAENDLSTYSTDENKIFSHSPDLVVFPQNASQVSEIIKIANQEKIPITARGAGTNVTGATVPVNGGIVLSFEKMNKLLEIDKENMMVVCEPGLINAHLQADLEKQGLFYPPDPASIDSCTIGGNVAECAGGMRAVKYGVTKDYVLGLEVVLASGEIVMLGGKLRKNVAGYDLLNLFVGSEGTLGITTKIILKVLPLPDYKINLWIPFSDYQNAFKMLSKIYQAKNIPTAIEFIEKPCIKAWEIFSGERHQYSDAAAHLLIEIDGNDLTRLEKECEIIAGLASNLNAIEVLYADAPALQKKFWDIRKKISEALRYAHGPKVSEDIVVPPASIYQFIQRIKELEKKSGFMIVGYGHLGDGNIHVNILKNKLPTESWDQQLESVIENIFDIVLELQGSITGEHGIGLTKKKYLAKAIGQKSVHLMKEIKTLFDPNQILNPGKIFD